MSSAFKPWNPLQPFLLPPSPDEWLPQGHVALLLIDLVQTQLDLSKIIVKRERRAPRGAKALNPYMMTALLLYGYCTGVVSSRRMERRTYEDVAFRVLAGGEHPDHTCISEFRREHLSELRELFVQVLRICQKAGLVKVGHVALDGTKVQANASKHKAQSYDRMHKTEAELRREIAELMQQAEQVDAQEDAQFGHGRRGDEVPEELKRKQDRLERLTRARLELEAEAAAARARELEDQARRASDQEESHSDEGEAKNRAAGHARGRRQRADAAAAKAREVADAAHLPAPDTSPRESDELPSHQVPHDKDGKPTGSAQRNFTDPDSRIMKKGGDYLQGYNCQAAVDAGTQIIVASAVTNQAPDQEHLIGMSEQIGANCGRLPEKLSADAGYWSDENAAYCYGSGIDAYIATGRHAHGRVEGDADKAPESGANAKTEMAAKLQTEEGRATYARRKAIVEPVFGNIKEARGFRRFSLRGLEKVRGEWALVCTAHNLLKLFKESMRVQGTGLNPAPA